MAEYNAQPYTYTITFIVIKHSMPWREHNQLLLDVNTVTLEFTISLKASPELMCLLLVQGSFPLMIKWIKNGVVKSGDVQCNTHFESVILMSSSNHQ